MFGVKVLPSKFFQFGVTFSFDLLYGLSFEGFKRLDCPCAFTRWGRRRSPPAKVNMESFNFYVTVTEAFECYLLGLSSGRLDNGILTVDTSSHIAKERIRIGRPDVSSPEDLTVPDGVECTLNIPRLAVLSTFPGRRLNVCFFGVFVCMEMGRAR